jgi:hypothetical protein
MRRLSPWKRFFIFMVDPGLTISTQLALRMAIEDRMLSQRGEAAINGSNTKSTKDHEDDLPQRHRADRDAQRRRRKLAADARGWTRMFLRACLKSESRSKKQEEMPF